jgi:tetratricopeptide (TPR) repeat protein
MKAFASPRGAVLAAALVASCHVGPDVTRLSHGEDVEGHFVYPDAYAAYLQGTLLEASGDPDGAASSYEAALRLDPAAAEIWSRLGVARCTRNRLRSDFALTRATALGPNLEAVWLALAECDTARGDASNAVAHARRAAALAPLDRDATRAVANALDAAANSVEAARWRRGLALLRPEVHEDAASVGVARRTEASAAVDRAIVAGDADDARAAAIAGRISRAELSFRALAFGRLDLAKQEAARILSEEPGNADARAAALVAADLTRDDAAFGYGASALPETRTRLSAAGVLLMEALLKRRAGDVAVRAWTDATACVTAPGSRACKNPVE